MDNAESRTDNAGESLGAVSADASATNRDPAPKTASAVGTSSLVSLTWLAPRYDEAQHGSYLGRLESAVQDLKSRNIALSGPYGTGKSSVLDKFEENHKSSTLRLAISTLAPDAEGAGLTNRIQKELVKQLVYGASPRTLRHSTSPATPQVASSQGPWPPGGRGRRGCNVQARAGHGLEVMRGSTSSVRDGDDQFAPHVPLAAERERRG